MTCPIGQPPIEDISRS